MSRPLFPVRRIAALLAGVLMLTLWLPVVSPAQAGAAIAATSASLPA